MRPTRSSEPGAGARAMIAGRNDGAPMTNILLTNLALLDAEAGALRAGFQVLVRDDRIAAVGPGLTGSLRCAASARGTRRY